MWSGGGESIFTVRSVWGYEAEASSAGQMAILPAEAKRVEEVNRSSQFGRCGGMKRRYQVPNNKRSMEDVSEHEQGLWRRRVSADKCGE